MLIENIVHKINDLIFVSIICDFVRKRVKGIHKTPFQINKVHPRKYYICMLCTNIQSQYPTEGFDYANTHMVRRNCTSVSTFLYREYGNLKYFIDKKEIRLTSVYLEFALWSKLNRLNTQPREITRRSRTRKSQSYRDFQ